MDILEPPDEDLLGGKKTASYVNAFCAWLYPSLMV